MKRFDWRQVNKFILTLFATLIAIWIARQLVFGGELGGVDVAIATAVSVAVVRTVLRETSAS